MLEGLRGRLSYANVMSTIAVLFAVGGGAAYAANTVFSSDIVNGEVKTQDIADAEMRIAALSSAARPGHCAAVLDAVAASTSPARDAWLPPLVATAAASDDADLLKRALAAVAIGSSPAPALGAAVVPTSRSGAGAIGIAAIAPPASEPPSCPPAGAVPAIPSGRSAGAKAARFTVSA